MEKIALVLCNTMHMDIEKANILLNHILHHGNFEIVCDYTMADIVIVYTCAFGPNKRKSVRILADVRANAKSEAKVIATGCLLKLNFDELKALDGIEPIYFDELIARLDGNTTQRVLEIKPYLPQNKVIISEGCLHNCSYCVYPKLCSGYKSKPKERIIEEVRKLDEVENTIYITGAEETADYGIDLYAKRCFPELMEELASIFPRSNFVIGWFHPAGLTPEMVKVIQEHKNISEIMLHIQHVDDEILRAMGRPLLDTYAEKIRMLKEARPELIISTEVIVGFPGEDEQKFQKLVEFLDKGFFSDIGVASYEAVLGTKASRLPNQVSSFEKTRRMNFLVSRYENVTCYPADDFSSSSVIEEYFKAWSVLKKLPSNIRKQRQTMPYVAGVDTEQKLERLKEHLSDVCKRIVDSRSEFEKEKNKAYLKAVYTQSARVFFFQVIFMGNFKTPLIDRAKEMLLDEQRNGY